MSRVLGSAESQMTKKLPHRNANILTCRDVGLWHCDVANLLYNKLQNCCELVRWRCCTTYPQPVSVQWSLALKPYAWTAHTLSAMPRTTHRSIQPSILAFSRSNNKMAIQCNILLLQSQSNRQEGQNVCDAGQHCAIEHKESITYYRLINIIALQLQTIIQAQAQSLVSTRTVE